MHGAHDQATDAPGPRGLALLGSLRAILWGNPIAAFLADARDHGDVFRYHLGPVTFWMINHPDHVRHVLQENQRNYRKSFNYDELKPVMGEGLLTSDGDKWLRQRRLMQPAFHRQKLAALSAIMAGATERMLARWRALSGGAPFDLAAEMMRLTLGIASLAFFGVDISGAADAVGAAVLEVSRWADVRTRSIIRLPTSLPTPANLRARRAVRALDEVVFRIIGERRRSGQVHHDLLSMLLHARDEDGEGMSDQQLRDEVMTFLLAGHETTALALTWSFYLLARDPQAFARVREEAQRELAGRAPGPDDLSRLPYAGMVVDEALRLYPPAWLFERQANQDDVIEKYRVPKDALLIICPYVLHRHPAFWERPERFDPERFTAERSAQRPRFAYLPFGGGPRQCIGNQFALMEARLVLAMVAQEFAPRLVPGRSVALEPLVTLRPRGGLWMTLAEGARA